MHCAIQCFLITNKSKIHQSTGFIKCVIRTMFFIQNQCCESLRVSLFLNQLLLPFHIINRKIWCNYKYAHKHCHLFVRTQLHVKLYVCLFHTLYYNGHKTVVHTSFYIANNILNQIIGKIICIFSFCFFSNIDYQHFLTIINTHQKPFNHLVNMLSKICRN